MTAPVFRSQVSGLRSLPILLLALCSSPFAAGQTPSKAVTADPATGAVVWPAPATFRTINSLGRTYVASGAPPSGTGLDGDVYVRTDTGGIYSKSGGTWSLQLTPALAGHTHPLGELQQSGATTGQIPKWNGSAWVPSADTGSAAWGDITGTLSAQADLQAALDGKQPLDSDLTAIASIATTASGRSLLTASSLTAAGLGLTNGAALDALGAVASNGLLTRTAANTYAARTLAGTAGQITVTAGDGVSGNPTISLPSTITQATTFSQNLTVASTAIILNSTAGVDRNIYVRSAGVDRWLIGVNSAAETGSNAGSDFQIRGYSDAGALSSVAYLTMVRATGETRIWSTTAATSTTTGALRVSGGLGVAGAGWFGGDLNAFSSTLSPVVTVGSDTAGFTGSYVLRSGSGNGSTINVWRAATERWRQTFTSGDAIEWAYIPTSANALWRLSNAGTLSLTVASNAALHFGSSAVANGGGYLFTTSAGRAIMAGGGYFGGGNWNATATSFSALDLGSSAGGLSIYGNTGLTAGGTFSPTTLLTLSSAGLLTTSSGNFTATTASTSSTTGALVVAGGVGIAGNVNVGGSANNREVRATRTGANASAIAIQSYTDNPSIDFSAVANSGIFGLRFLRDGSTELARLLHSGTLLLGTTTDAGNGKLQVAGGISATSTIIAPAATTSLASIRLPHGTAPTSPTNGDVWTETGGVYARVNGATKQLDAAGGATSPVLTLYHINSGSANPAASTDYVLGLPGSPFAVLGFYDNAKMAAPVSGTINKVYIRVRVAGTLASNETVSIYVRKNGTTDSTAITGTWNASNVEMATTTLGLSVAAGDYLALKVSTPAWTTNPTSVSVFFYAWIDPS